MDNKTDAARVAARLRSVDDHIRCESAHQLDELMTTFGAEPEWHDQPGQQVLRGHDAIRVRRSLPVSRTLGCRSGTNSG